MARKQFIVIQQSNRGAPSRCSQPFPASSQPFPASCNLIPTFIPIGFLAGEGFPLGSSEAYSVRLVKFPTFLYSYTSPKWVHWEDNERNPRQLLLNSLIPHGKVFPRGKAANVTHFPCRGSICIWKIGSHLACQVTGLHHRTWIIMGGSGDVGWLDPQLISTEFTQLSSHCRKRWDSPSL